MKKLEVVIRPESLEDIKAILNEHGCGGMTMFSGMGCGNQKGIKGTEFKGVKLNINLLPKIQVNAIIQDEILEAVLTEINEKISTGGVGDGKVFIYEVFDVMRIRTGERGSNAI
ncbi:P-II family nitrogen regulator [Clostridium vincentii]|uniref:Nitrogen regulatory protein P-II n=1 Tax=Clostridium vincentii TaxID=52704 RepID=A0A2T0BB03_9CLOT|nr:P-II family nitrogen regulator [Clostridium vincentii]PRR81013.1 Nitrogen regulatory protein P-II [Clostridium vincentii]